MGDRSIDVVKTFLHICHRHVPNVIIYKLYFGEGGDSKMCHRCVLGVVIYGPHIGEGNDSKNHKHYLTWSIYSNIPHNKNEIHE